MPSPDTFDIAPIGSFVQKYLHKSHCSVDPFARNKRWATYTNDLNPDTVADYHLEALDFLSMLHKKGIQADLVIFDPPYSTRQINECYQKIGINMTQRETQQPFLDWKRAISKICTGDAVVLSFGWSTVGMGTTKGWKILEIMLVCHGGMHNDTICMAERRTQGILSI